jgi:superfamily II DNA or RNA helicase
LIREVKSFSDAHTKNSEHLIDVDYIDGWNFPSNDTLIWEREFGTRILSKVSLPEIGTPNLQPDKPEMFSAFVDAIKWSTSGKIADLINLPDEYLNYPITSPWKSAVQVEDYQLYPVLKSMTMPRVSLLLADDVGVGKTIEAGLILSELIAQRGIRRIMIVCPASIQEQWKEELKEKFNLDFVIINSSEVFNIQRSLGMDANPWTTSPRIITSMDYLRQQDILDRFASGAMKLQPDGSAMLPWDLLVVDEAHNLSPSMFGDDSLRCQMLRQISKYFEHRLFLTATPHNGFTVSFTGLLEMLDPLRFTQKTTLEDKDNAQIQASVVRRLKSELNAGRAVPRFVKRDVEGIPLHLDGKEKALFDALRKYREEGIKVVAKKGKREKNLGRFIFSILTKRLLSSSYAFARTWWNHVAGFDLEGFDIDEADRSRVRAEAAVVDDDEKERRESDAVRHGAGWLQHFAQELKPFIKDVSSALESMGWTSDVVDHGIEGIKSFPLDKKWDALVSCIEEILISNKTFRNDERLIIFTEYKDTQDYLIARFKEHKNWKYPEIQCLFGGASQVERSLVKQEFNDPRSPLRILVATDVAAEGLNLQNSCRYIIHQEVPWNPMRLEQRNGRVDRYGQGRDVTVFHFASDDDADIQFLSYVVNKVHQVREDLGSVGQVLDEAVFEHFSGKKINTGDIDDRLDKTSKISPEKQDLGSRDSGSEKKYEESLRHMQAVEFQMGLNEKNLNRLLAQALLLEKGTLKEENPGIYRFDYVPPSWKKLVTTSLTDRNEYLHGTLPKIVFDPKYFTVLENNRPIFRPKHDTVLLRLGHPIMQKAVTVLRRHLWEESNDIHRWTMVQSNLPRGIDIVICVYCTVSVRNNLGETAYSQVLELPFILQKSMIEKVEFDLWNEIKRLDDFILTSEQIDFWNPIIHECWMNNVSSVEKSIEKLKDKIRIDFNKSFSLTIKKLTKDESKRFDDRVKELETEKNPRSLEKLRKEFAKANTLAMQLTFSEEKNLERQRYKREIEVKLSDAEWERQHTQVMLLKQRLESEKERLLDKVLPRRYSLSSIDVQPIAVKVILQQRGDAT